MAFELDPTLRERFVRDCEPLLFTKLRDREKQELWDIIWENSRLHGNSQMCLQFRGEIFQTVHHEKFPHPVNLIHPEVRPRLKQYLETKEKTDRARDLCLGYIGNILMRTVNFMDLLLLIPDSVADVLWANAQQFDSGPSTMTMEDIEAFKAANFRGYQLFKAQEVFNFLDITK